LRPFVAGPNGSTCAVLLNFQLGVFCLQYALRIYDCLCKKQKRICANLGSAKYPHAPLTEWPCKIHWGGLTKEQKKGQAQALGVVLVNTGGFDQRRAWG
jgi:hypothetical protein